MTAPRGEWILGRGWDQNDWSETAMPNQAVLSRAVLDHPVRLTRIDGRAALVNARAMVIAPITRETKDPPGGAILHDAAGGADLGTLEVGKQADFIAVDRDVIGGPPEEIPKVKVLWKVVGGRTEFEPKER